MLSNVEGAVDIKRHAGLDPAIHPLRKISMKMDGCAGLRLAEGGFGPAGGSSPRMTAEINTRPVRYRWRVTK
jgi:hypothetical protein